MMPEARVVTLIDRVCTDIGRPKSDVSRIAARLFQLSGEHNGNLPIGTLDAILSALYDWIPADEIVGSLLRVSAYNELPTLRGNPNTKWLGGVAGYGSDPTVHTGLVQGDRVTISPIAPTPGAVLLHSDTSSRLIGVHVAATNLGPCNHARVFCTIEGADGDCKMKYGAVVLDTCSVPVYGYWCIVDAATWPRAGLARIIVTAEVEGSTGVLCSTTPADSDAPPFGSPLGWGPVWIAPADDHKLRPTLYLDADAEPFGVGTEEHPCNNIDEMCKHIAEMRTELPGYAPIVRCRGTFSCVGGAKATYLDSIGKYPAGVVGACARFECWGDAEYYLTASEPNSRWDPGVHALEFDNAFIDTKHLAGIGPTLTTRNANALVYFGCNWTDDDAGVARRVGRTAAGHGGPMRPWLWVRSSTFGGTFSGLDQFGNGVDIYIDEVVRDAVSNVSFAYGVRVECIDPTEYITLRPLATITNTAGRPVAVHRLGQNSSPSSSLVIDTSPEGGLREGVGDGIAYVQTLNLDQSVDEFLSDLISSKGMLAVTMHDGHGVGHESARCVTIGEHYPFGARSIVLPPGESLVIGWAVDIHCDVAQWWGSHDQVVLCDVRATDIGPRAWAANKVDGEHAPQGIFVDHVGSGVGRLVITDVDLQYDSPPPTASQLAMPVRRAYIARVSSPQRMVLAHNFATDNTVIEYCSFKSISGDKLGTLPPNVTVS